MKILSFKLEGNTACFKMPEINTIGSTSLALTYNYIHKIALIGMFGAILGYDGYRNQKKNDTYPEFYKKLISMKVAIKPLDPFPNKSLHTFVNQSGHVSQITQKGVKRGVTLVYKEQYLENPSWMIYVKIEDDQPSSGLLADTLLNHKSHFDPYLGKTQHPAKIRDVKLIDGVAISQPCEIKSLIPHSIIKDDHANKAAFYVRESLPCALSKETNHYVYETFVYSDQIVDLTNWSNIYCVDDENICFT